MTKGDDNYYQRLKELFKAVCELGPEERKAYLDQECGQNPVLRSELEALLECDSDAEKLLQSVDPEKGNVGEQLKFARAMTGVKIGRYKIRSLIGAGGMGMVYEAVQEQPHRTVALKVMRKGIASRSAMRRFEYEAQILSRLQHPGIAQIYEAGMHYEESVREGGEPVPYFAMEYIAGAQTLIEYIEHKKLSTRERLSLFIKVCEAISCGHQQGIIHRDLKPANILVDAAGQPRIIDFGVARATDSDLAVTTLQTDIGQLIGTVQYMSPEQCVGDPNALDTRSDVYSLGVVLYEMLCGQLPYDVTVSSVYEATQIIKDKSPRRLSSVNHALHGDIETITQKALEKDPLRRYQSAVELGQDIGRYLEDKPIVARPPSTFYQLSKFTKRNKVLVGSIAVVFMVLVIWLISLNFSLAQTRQARAEAETVIQFLENMLASVDPGLLGREVLVKDALDYSASKIDKELSGQPLVQARLRYTMGMAYISLGEFASGEVQLKQVWEIRKEQLGARHIETIRAEHQYGVALLKQYRVEEAEPIFMETLELRLATLGAEHVDSLESKLDLAVLYHISQRYNEAEPLMREAVEGYKRVLGLYDAITLTALNSLGTLLYQLGQDGGDADKLAESERVFEEAYKARKATLGADHPDTLDSEDCLAMVYYHRGNRVEDALNMMRRTLAVRKKIQGVQHERTISVMINLAGLLRGERQYNEAEQLLRDANRQATAALGADNPLSLYSANELVAILILQDRYQEALDLMSGLVRVLEQAGRQDLAEYLLLGLYKQMSEAISSESNEYEHVKKLMGMIADFYEDWGKGDSADNWRGRLEAATSDGESGDGGG